MFIGRQDTGFARRTSKWLASRKIAPAIAALYIGLSTTAASAQDYNWSFSDTGGTLLGSGTLTTDPTINDYRPFPNSPLGYSKTVTAMTGQFMGQNLRFTPNPVAPQPYQPDNFYIGNNQLVLGGFYRIDSYGLLVGLEDPLTPGNLISIEGPSNIGPYAWFLGGSGTAQIYSGDFALTAAQPFTGAGGTMIAPTALPTGVVTGVNGQIGGDILEQFYSFDWQGGLFSATATITGAQATDTFKFLLSGGQGFDALILRLDQLSDYSGTFTEMLAAGRYTIGIFDAGPIDPAFSIRFDTAIMQSAIPEPATWAMMLVGFGMLGGAVRHSRARSTAVYA